MAPAFQARHPPIGETESVTRLWIAACGTGWPSGPITRARIVAPRRSVRLTTWSGMPDFNSTAR